MSNITEQAEWSPVVYLIDVTTPVRGGSPDFDINNNPTAGYSNAQAKQLADRTLYLKETIENTDIDVGALDTRVVTVETSLTAHIGSRGSAHTNVTTTEAGFMSTSDKTKLNGIETGAQANVATNLAQGTRTTTTVPVTSSTGTSATLDIATTSLAGVMSSADKTKLNSIAVGAQVNAVTSVASKTGAVTLVKADVGLGNVDNTADTAKPVSTAQQTALNLKADLASPALTGVPTAPTATVGTNTTQIATTAFVLANVGSTNQPFMQVQDQKSLGTSGGTATATAANVYIRRDLNTTILNEIPSASLSTNQVSLPAGSYTITAISTFNPGGQANQFKIQIWNETDSVQLLEGLAYATTGTPNNNVNVFVGGKFSIAGTKSISLRYSIATGGTNTLGSASSRGTAEIYSDLRITKVS